ncbi:carboxypeptidase-like regulatory domain-containing protein [Bacteroidota bacterium]
MKYIINKILITFLLIIFTQNIYNQTNTISGYVTDENTGETIIGATVVLKGTLNGTITDLNGFFTLSKIPEGLNTLNISHLSYITKEIQIDVDQKKSVLDVIKLSPDLKKISEVAIVEIKPDEIGDKQVEISQLEITPKAIKSIPTARNDIFKAIKYLPGIGDGETFSPLYSARGGDPSENLVMLDGVVMYNPYHYVTTSGIFNVQTVKKIDILVGGFGAEYGGRNSSILYITTKDGNLNEIHGEIEPSTTHTKAFIEFPVNEKSSITAAGRYYYDLPGMFFLGGRSWFYDLNLSYTNRINNKNRLTLKLFSSLDRVNQDINTMFSYFSNTFDDIDVYDDMDIDMKNNWGAHAITGILKTIISPKIYLRTQVYGSFHSSDNFSGMKFRFPVEEEGILVQMDYNTSFKAKIKDLSAKSTLNINLTNNNTVKLGIEYNDYYFKNSAIINDIDKGENIRSPNLISTFIEDKIMIGRLIIRPGVRATNYNYYGNWLLEPRFNSSFNVTNNFKINAAWGQFNQHIISMNTQEYEVNQMLDYYYPLKDRKPLQSIQYLIGFEKNISYHSNVSVNFYYKEMPTTYMFDLNEDAVERFSFSDILLKGTGESYGAEILWKGNWKKFSGWLSYGYAKSYRSYNEIMDGKKFLFDYDRTHSFKTIVNYKITENIDYNTSLLVLTGLPRTIERTQQSFYYYDPISNQYGFYFFGISETKNNARLPFHLGLDFGIKKEIRNGFGYDLMNYFNFKESYLNITVSNVFFFRRNVIWYFGLPTMNKYLPVGINFFPSFSVGYTLKF